MNLRSKIVFIGASAGGVSALQRLFIAIADQLTWPIVIVQHLPANSSVDPALAFASCCKLQILEASDKMTVLPRHVYFAPPSYHLLIERDGTLALSQDEPVHYSRPSIDVLFESAAVALGRRACGVLLTGANSDGALGLKTIQDSGGMTMVQNIKDAEVQTMPQSALNIMKPGFIGTVETIAQKLLELQSLESL